MLELLIGLAITVAVGYFIVKGYKPAGVLLTAGLILLMLTGILGHTNPTFKSRINGQHGD